jgi:hypothetical protein
MFANDERDASLAPNIFEGGPSHATGENVHTLSMFFFPNVMEIEEC